MAELPTTINFEKWIDDNRGQLKPPVGNKQLFPTGDDFIAMVVGGPNQRTDFHVDPYEEFFYQIKGDIHLNVMTDDGPDRIDIREGEMWVLPRSLPHSPQRSAASIGLVIERVREEGTLEKFRWYCANCDAVVHEVEVQVRDIVEDLPPLFNAFYESAELRTCPQCGTLHPGKG
jgi:3-hydroxyanthranilate 3,4-dioxygenase